MHESIADITNINLSAIKTGTSLDPVLVSSMLMCLLYNSLGKWTPVVVFYVHVYRCFYVLLVRLLIHVDMCKA